VAEGERQMKLPDYKQLVTVYLVGISVDAMLFRFHLSSFIIGFVYVLFYIIGLWIVNAVLDFIIHSNYFRHAISTLSEEEKKKIISELERRKHK
jgi:hypothetical protein